MRLHLTDQSPRKKPFVVAGIAAGVLVSAWYLYGNAQRTVPDAVWSRFVNVSLILFVCIYAANLLRRIVDFFLRKR